MLPCTSQQYFPDKGLKHVGRRCNGWRHRSQQYFPDKGLKPRHPNLARALHT